MRLRKSGVFVALVMVVALSVAASTSTASRSAVTTVTLASNTNTTLAFDVLIANFKKAYPNIEIKTTYYDINTYQTLIPTQFAAGNAPDLVWMPASAGAHSVKSLARGGRLVNLAG